MRRFNLSRRLTLRGYRWFWNFTADNGEVVFQGHTRGYSRKIDAAKAVELARGSDSAEIWENGKPLPLSGSFNICGLSFLQGVEIEEAQAIFEQEEWRP